MNVNAVTHYEGLKKIWWRWKERTAGTRNHIFRHTFNIMMMCTKNSTTFSSTTFSSAFKYYDRLLTWLFCASILRGSTLWILHEIISLLLLPDNSTQTDGMAGTVATILFLNMCVVRSIICIKSWMEVYHKLFSLSFTSNIMWRRSI